MSGPNWSRLYAQGRCKALGVSFNDEEQKAIHVLGIPVDYVRAGVVTLEDYKKALKNETNDSETPMFKMDREELFKMAVELGIQASPIVTKETLIDLIQKDTKIKKAKAKQAGATANAYKKQAEQEEKDIAARDLRVKKEKEEQAKKYKNDEEKVAVEHKGIVDGALAKQTESEEASTKTPANEVEEAPEEEEVVDDPKDTTEAPDVSGDSTEATVGELKEPKETAKQKKAREAKEKKANKS